MNDYNRFWEIMEKCDWKYEGDDDRVLEPVIEYLSQQADEEIFLFDDMMAELLYAIDTKDNAKKSEKAAGYLSDDTFLYSRCVALINGSEYYKNVLNGMADDLWNMEFESLLYVPGQAWSIKHNKDYADYPHLTKLSYETGSNKDGWK
jgi:hypothetical protein